MKNFKLKSNILIAGLLLFLTSLVYAKPGLFFCNKSPSKVDSVVLYTDRDTIALPSIDRGNQAHFDIPFAWENTHGAQVCEYRVYFKDKYFKGEILKGISGNTISIEQDFNPQSRFTIFIDNASHFSIDKVEPANCVIDSSYEVSPRKRAIAVNYLEFLKEPKVEIFINGKLRSVSLRKHDLYNLSNLSASIWLSDSTALPGPIPFESMVEFTIILQPAALKMDLQSMTIKSSALIKVYTLPNLDGKVLIFDFDRLRTHPFFVARLYRKRFKIKLSERDLSEVYYGRKYFFVSGKWIKAQY